MSDLTDKQRRFVEEYCTDFNATRAAERAGYNGNDNTLGAIGGENLRKPKIAEAVEKRLEELSMSSAEATKRMADWGRGSLSPFMREVNGDLVIDLTSEEAKQNLHLISEIQQDITFDGDEPVKKVKIKMYDAKDAVTKLMKAHGAFKQQIDVTSGGEALKFVWTEEGDDA